MKKRQKLIWVLIVVILAFSAAQIHYAAEARTAQWICAAGASCHMLLEEGAELYLLTADGHVLIEINGADSVRLENVE